MVCGAGSCQNRVLPGDTVGAERSWKKWCVCTRERRQCNLSSYCAALQPISRASCGGKCAQKWHFHGESRRVPASTHVIGCNNPRDEVARHKKCKILVYCAAPQQICETRTRCKRAQISELVHDAHTLQLAILTPCTAAKRQCRAQNTVRQVV